VTPPIDELPPAAEVAEVVEAIAGIEAPPGTEVWDRAVAFELLLAYDRDRSGSLDRRREVDAIPCEVFVRIDTALAERSEYPGLYATYGFPADLVWLGHFLGFDRRVRVRAEEHLRACGLLPQGPDVGPRVEPEIQDFVTGMLLGLPDPGSPVWLERARLVLLLTYDADDSGLLDAAPELRSIDCQVWHALDGTLFAADQGSLVDLLGLRSDLPFGGDLIGISPAIAPTAYDVARRCDLQDAPP
jgi:hypothetical protein